MRRRSLSIPRGWPDFFISMSSTPRFDHIGQNRLTLLTRTVVLVYQVVQMLRVIAVSVVLHIDIVVGEVLTQIHRQTRRDAPLADVDHQEMAVLALHPGSRTLQMVHCLVSRHAAPPSLSFLPQIPVDEAPTVSARRP